jgi:oxaloacetate decarboxylase (Na+ extruding) subunit alpha
MAHVAVIDQTLGHGQHILWKDYLTTDMLLPIAATLDRVGYKAIDRASQSSFKTLATKCGENPWEGLKLLARSFRHTPIRASVRCPTIVEDSIVPEAVMELWIRKLCECGVRSFCLYDPLHDHIDQIGRLAAVAARYGCEVVTAIFFVEDSAHTDAYYAKAAAKLTASTDIKGLIVWDTAGVLKPSRVRSLVPAILEYVPGNLEILSHNVLGISPVAYLAGFAHGVRAIHTCSRPLANGSSLPSIEVTVHNLQLAGHAFDIRQELLEQVAENFRKAARNTGLPIGSTREYDLYVFKHQLQGGASQFLQTALEGTAWQGGMDAVFLEIARIREELGFPPMVEPFSEMIQEIAVGNILTGQRYAEPSEKLLQYTSGHFGNPIGVIDPVIRAKIECSSAAKLSGNKMECQVSLAALRKQHKQISDEEIVMKYICGDTESNPKITSRACSDTSLAQTREVDQVVSLLKQANVCSIEIETNEMSVTLLR